MPLTSLQPAYLVIVATPYQTPTETRFSSTDLLTARRAAMTFAESVHQRSDESPIAQLEVYLIEQENDRSSCNRIARIFRHYVGADGYVRAENRLPDSQLAPGRNRCLDNLTQLIEEGQYYALRQHPEGLGPFRLRVRNGNHDVVAEGDVLADALAYAHATLDNFNRFESAGRGYELLIQVSANDDRTDLITSTVIPGYVVSLQSVAGPPSTRSFLNEDLLTARHEAFQYARQQINQRPPGQRLTVDVHLAEFDGDRTIGCYIARVFSQHFGNTPTETEAFAGIEKEDPDQVVAYERFSSPLAVWKSLSEMNCEYELYTAYQHPPGFGFVKLTLSSSPSIDHPALWPVDPQQSPARRALLADRLSELRRPLPYNTFRLLQDGLGYAVGLIERYNRRYGKTQGQLSFTLDELPPTYV